MLVACAPRAAVVIGADLPLAGRDGADGLMASHGIELALEDANAASPHVLFTLDLRDTARGGFQNPHVDEGTDNVFDPAHGAENLRAFGENPRVFGVLGPLRENVAAADIPVSERYGLPLISGSAAVEEEGGPVAGTFFSIAPSRRLTGSAVAACARSPLHFRRVFVVSDGTREGGALAAAFRAEFERRGGVSAGALQVSRTDAGAAALIDAIARARADSVLFAPARPLRAAFFTPGAIRRVFTAKNALLMTFGAFDPRASLRPKDRYAEIRDVEVADSADGAAFIERFRRRFHEYPSDEAARFYVATLMLTRAVRLAANDGTALPARLSVVARLRAEAFDSFLGPQQFDGRGNLARSDFLLVSGTRTLGHCPASL